MPRKAEGQFITGPEGISFRYTKTVGHDPKGKPIKERVTEPLNTKNEILAERRAAALLKAEAEGRAASVEETFEDAARRVNAIRAVNIPTAPRELAWLKNHAFKAIGAMPVKEVSKADLMAVLDHMRDEGYADESIRHARKSMHYVFHRLKREGVRTDSPVPEVDELPEALPETFDERPKAVLSDEELFTYLEYSDPREGEAFRRPVRERQLMTLLSRCVGGMRTGELLGLAWTRAGVDMGFDRVEVIRYKNRRKATKRGSKSSVRQLYPLGDTVLPYFLRYWYVRHVHMTGATPDPKAMLFPVTRDPRVGSSRAGEQRGKDSMAKELRRDVKRAFGLEVYSEEVTAEARERVQKTRELAERGFGQREIARKLGISQPTVNKLLTGVANGMGRGPVGRWVPASSPTVNQRRLAELLEGTEDRKRLVFHSSRNMAAVAAERAVRLQAAAQTTAHTARMLQHYREMAGEVDVVPVRPDFLPDGERLVLVLREWCRLDGIALGEVFGHDLEEPPAETTENDSGKGGVKRRSLPSHPKPMENREMGFRSDSRYFTGIAGESALLSRRPEVRVLSGAPEIIEDFPAETPAEHAEKAERKGGEPRNGPKQGAKPVEALPPGVVTAADLRKAIDAALVAGDVHLARRLNAFAGELEESAPANPKGGNHGKR